MRNINFHMGVNLRCYGNVVVKAETVEEGMKLLTADYIGEHIDIKETTTDSGQDLAVIDASDDDTGEELGDWAGHSLPSEYDPKPPAPVIVSSCFALAIDNDRACELHLFASEEERDSHLWDYAFENAGTLATTLDDFKDVYGGDLGEAMAATNDGWHTDEMVAADSPVADHASDTVDALTQAESFISGFEDDETQEGIGDILAGLRAAIPREQARPDLLSALITVAGKIGSYHDADSDNAEMHIIADIEATIDAAIAKAEGRS